MAKPTIEEYINKAQYDPHGILIWAIAPDNNIPTILVDIRGWGHICNLFPEADEADEAEKFQDELGEWIADAINQKLNKNRTC